MRFFTIGVYNSTETEFFNKLKDNAIDTFCDIRQRRGVRGAKYAFVNSQRLQQKLNELNISYGYVSDLAPTSEIRSLQKTADIENGELKSERQSLGQTFTIEYDNQILGKFDFDYFFEQLEQSNAQNIVLFCVEELPQACHRSLVASKLTTQYNYQVTNL